MGPDHIGLLVNGVFNASIPASKIPPEFVANAEAGEANRLVHATTGQVIEAGAAITFMVTAYVWGGRGARVGVGAGGCGRVRTLNWALKNLMSRGHSKNATRLETVNAILTISGSLLPEDGAVDLNAGTPARKVRTGGSAWATLVRRSWPLGPPFLVAHTRTSSCSRSRSRWCF